MNAIPDLLERFRRGPELLAVVLTGLGVEETDYAPAPGAWSIRQIVAHVADSELVGGHRLRLVIAEDNPKLTAFDQDAWTRNLDYARRKPKDSLEFFRRLRAENHALLKDLGEEVFERAGDHTENGRMTLRQLVQGYADHAESHARQLQSIRERYKQTKGRS